MAKKKKRLTIMVSSTVYGIEELLDQVYALLGGFGYEVWMSHKGTVPVYPDQTALESCLTAVAKCDLFLSIITPRYGSGIIDGQLSITHQELLKSIELKRARWILGHDHVVFARTLFRKLGARNQQEREQMLKTLGFVDADSLRRMRKREELVFDDIRVIDMYEAAIRHDLKAYQDRKGNWVQKFEQPDDAKLFATAQFSRYREIEQFLHEQFADKEEVQAKVTGGTPS
jgi:Domain of unknown function (DUF4062)